MNEQATQADQCKHCHGKGHVAFPLGTARCGACNGTGRDCDLGFVANVRRQLQGEERKGQEK